MNVKPCSQFLAQSGSLLQRGILERESRVEAEEGGGGGWSVERGAWSAGRPVALAVADEGEVLFQALVGNACAVAIGDFIAQTGAQAGLFDCLLDRCQRTRNRVGAGVVVYERRRVVTNRIEQGDQRAVIAILGGQG